MESIKRFEDTDIWKDSVALSKMVYLLTKDFPSSEQFGLTSQLRRSVNSISANFAEGFGRHSNKDKHRFYTIAHGSLLETKSFLYLSVELGFCKKAEIRETILLVEKIQKQLSGIKKYFS